MKTLYLRNVPDEVVDRLERLAARTGASLSATAVTELAESSRRVDNAELLGALPDLGIRSDDIVSDIEEERSSR